MTKSNKTWKMIMACSIGWIIIAAALWPQLVLANKTERGRKEATNSNASYLEKKASKSNAPSRNGNSLGDIWDEWTGKTSFRFLDGTQGDGSKERPFLIKNREQLMGLSELAAMGMMVPDAEGADYVGDYAGSYIALGANIDMQGVDWIPIGFYRDSSEMPGKIENVFQGNFDGNGHTVRNLRLNRFEGYDYVGLFGSVDHSVIHDVVIIPDTQIKGNDRVGTVAGYAANSEIRNVTVKNTALNATGIVGGIAGEISGTVIENAVCDNVILDAHDGKEVIYIGGIAGIASDSVIVDCDVSTGTGSTARIQGTGYTGGIVGFQNSADIYNVHVNGIIGGAHSTAIGGITGNYVSGKLKVARFEGVIGNSRLGSAAREGTFIGTRQGAATNFNYIDDVAYLFADSESKIGANVCGSEIADDNDYTYAAHVGYWHGGDLYCTLIQGGSGKNITDRYFYEELEEGILKVMDETGSDRYTIDHFAPNSVGRPVRGYLVLVNQIDAVANGHNFYNVASLQARGASQYSGTIDKNSRGAIAAGSTVYVNTAPNNTETEKFQMLGNPWFMNIKGEKKDVAYSASEHCYTFQMPKEDIAIAAEYKKVAASIRTSPESYLFSVTQTRTGNRKNPEKTTVIKNKEGKLIARYINGVPEQGEGGRPVAIQAYIDANNDVSDSRVKWSLDDADLISLLENGDEDENGYTEKSASIAVNVDAGFFNSIINELEEKQREEGYRYKIPNTIYGAGRQNGGIAILTAATRPSTSFEGKPCTANCQINVTFQILDDTLVAAEGAVLDKQTLEYTVTRQLSGSRTKPEEKILVTEPQSLTVAFDPDYFSKDEVTWKAADPSITGVAQEEASYREALAYAHKDAKWIRDLIAADDGRKANDRYALLSESGERTTDITVEGKDRLGNHALATCLATVRFVTEDNTKIEPEAVRLSQTAMEFHLSCDKAGDIHSETIDKHGFEKGKLTAAVLPEIEDSRSHRPFDRGVKWISSDPSALSVDAEGNLAINDSAPWIMEAMAKAPYQAEKTVEITAAANDGAQEAKCAVSLQYLVNCIEADRETESFSIVLTKTGKRFAPLLAYTGQEPKKLNAAIYSGNPDLKHVVWSSEDASVVKVLQDGTIIPVLPEEGDEQKAPWIKEVLDSGRDSGTCHVLVAASTADGEMTDSVCVELSFTVIDKTHPSGGSGGSGGGGGGSASSGSSKTADGVTPNGKTTGAAPEKDAVSGTWIQMADEKWLFASERTYADEWAYINNPYAGERQAKAAWFRFDKEGFMVTGWFLAPDGNWYYMNPASDGSKGQMLTGWQQIEGAWYYLDPASDKEKGKLLTNTVVDGKYSVNENGQWN